MDDGFQNRKIHKDLEIVALTSATSSEKVFRDWPSSLKRANLLVWTKGLKRPATFGVPLVKVKYRLPKNPFPSDVLFWLVTGIGDGESACALMKESGYPVLRHLVFRDHESYDKQKVETLMREASLAGCRIILTGKDWVKWKDLGVQKTHVVVLEPEIIFEEGRENWSKLLWEK